MSFVNLKSDANHEKIGVIREFTASKLQHKFLIYFLRSFFKINLTDNC